MVKRFLFVVLLAWGFVFPASMQAQSSCIFQLGFKTLHDALPTTVGDCVENEHYNPIGDSNQQTTKGLLAWRKADNWTAFTDGYRTWINGPNGIVSRLNTERFPWEHDQATHVGPATAYPNAARNPGAIDPRVTQDAIAITICTPGYTETVRPPTAYTDALKLQQIAQYGYADTNPADYEEDHIVPLELGGNPSDPTNLWPEPYAPTPGAHEKDRVENSLHDQVCGGKMTLAAAQQAIETDWVAVYQQLSAPLPSSPSPAPSAPSATTGHTFYASTYGSAHTIYCDTDSEWKTLSKNYLVSFPSLEAAEAALPDYTLHQPC